jgi:mannose-6-phosphate isomerase
MNPLVFESYLRPQVWGGRGLQRYLGKTLPPEGAFGEAWEISAQPLHVSRVAEGPLAGTLLTDLWAQRGAELVGPNRPVGPEFPLLIKFLDCQDLLSIQVHPTDAIAQRLGVGNLGKTEAWVVLHAEPEGKIYAGLRPGVTPDELERRLDDGTAAQCLHGFTPKAGDCVFLPAGTVHAVGGGVIIAEVQQSSDVTFRLFDWNRVGADGKPRQLHRQQALASINWSFGPVSPLAVHSLARLPATVCGEQLAACEYFSIARFTLNAAPLDMPMADRLSIWMVLQGTVELSSADGYRRTFQQGETVMIPATAPALRWMPGNSPVILLAAGIGSGGGDRA